MGYIFFLNMYVPYHCTASFFRCCARAPGGGGPLNSAHHISRMGRSLAAPAAMLERSMAKDALHSKVRSRPGQAVLVRRGLVDPRHARGSEWHVDHSLAERHKRLERQMRADRVHARLRSRPTVHELHDAGILDKHQVMYGEARSKHEILDLHLSSRPSRAEVQRRGLVSHGPGEVHAGERLLSQHCNGIIGVDNSISTYCRYEYTIVVVY